MTPTNKEILNMALPAIISNVTVPLLGLVDVTITGHLGNVSYIGAIAVGGMLFNMIYWIFGFLRMGTGGMTSQSFGNRDEKECRRILLRSLAVSMSLATMLIVFQYPIRETALHFIDTSDEVKQYATTYFHICIWGAPAMLGLYSLTGWFIGLQNSRFPMFVAILQNIINILASLLFVLKMDMKIEGVAYGTLIAQYAGFFMAVSLSSKYLRKHLRNLYDKNTFTRNAMYVFFRINRDLFLRTLCIIAVTVFFMSSGAGYGDTILAVNTLLMQMFTIFSYIMDGFAYAGEAIVGRYYGERNDPMMRRTIKNILLWGAGAAVLFTLLYGAGGKDFLCLLTNESEVITSSSAYYCWVLAIPFAGFMAFILDGVCIGITATKIMLQSIFIASLTFFCTYYLMNDYMENHALWMAFIIYLSVRGNVQAYLTFRSLRSDFRAS